MYHKPGEICCGKKHPSEKGRKSPGRADHPSKAMTHGNMGKDMASHKGKMKKEMAY